MRQQWLKIGMVALGTFVVAQAVFIAGLLHDGVFTADGVFDRTKGWMGLSGRTAREKDRAADHVVFLGDDVRRMHDQINRMFEESFSHFGPPGFSSNATQARLARLPMPSASESPMEQMRRLQGEVDRTFRNAFRDMHSMGPVMPFDQGWERLTVSSSMNFEDHGDEFVVTVHLPGADKSRIQVETQGRLLTIAVGSLTNSAPGVKGQGASISHECFQSRLLLPELVREDDIQTDYDNERLTIRLPKKSRVVDTKKQD